VTTINVNTVAPAGSVLTVGDSGDTIVAVDEIKVNTVKDAGGNTLWVSNGSGVLSSVSGFGGALNLLSTQTASSSSSLSFTSGIDSTYKEYIFKFINLHSATDEVHFQFQVNVSGETGYNETVTSTFFHATHDDGGNHFFTYMAASDQAQGTSYQDLWRNQSNDTAHAGCGELHIFNPSSTTYAKNWFATTQNIEFSNPDDYSAESFSAGYFNVTGAITQVDFKFASGNIDAGKIKMYGVS